MSYRTYSEYLASPEFGEIRDEAMARAGDTCEMCGQATASEVHHVRYCRWGEYGTAEDLLAVCHACHEDAHRCQMCGQVTLKAAEIKAGSTVCKDCAKC